jgi:hypothetical protein
MVDEITDEDIKRVLIDRDILHSNKLFAGLCVQKLAIS